MRNGLPEINPAGVPSWLSSFLRVLRSEWQRRIVGVNGGLEKVVTFQDLVDLGITTETQAQAQAMKK